MTFRSYTILWERLLTWTVESRAILSKRQVVVHDSLTVTRSGVTGQTKVVGGARPTIFRVSLKIRGEDWHIRPEIGVGSIAKVGLRLFNLKDPREGFPGHQTCHSEVGLVPVDPRPESLSCFDSQSGDESRWSACLYKRSTLLEAEPPSLSTPYSLLSSFTLWAERGCDPFPQWKDRLLPLPVEVCSSKLLMKTRTGRLPRDHIHLSCRLSRWGPLLGLQIQPTERSRSWPYVPELCSYLRASLSFHTNVSSSIAR